MSGLRLLPAALLLTLWLASCAGNAAQGSGRTRPAEPGTNLPAAQLPGFPGDGMGSLRESSAGLNVSLAGGSWEDSTEERNMDSFVTMTAPAQETRWSYWRFTGLAQDAQISSLSAFLSHFSGGPIYSLLADFDNQRWVVTELDLEAGSQVVELHSGSAAGLVSPAGNLYVGLLVFDGRSTVVDSLTMLGNTELLPPAACTASDAEFDDKVLISWDPVPAATGYRIYYKLAGEPDSAYGLLTEIPDGAVTQFEHSLTDPPARPCVYAQHYVYRLQSTATGEESVEFSPADEGHRQLPAVDDFYVSDRVHEDHVRVIGFYFGNADQVNVLRDGVQIGTLAILDNTFLLQDDPGDTASHDYRIYAVGAEGLSEDGPVKSGCRVEWDWLSVALHDLTADTHAMATVVAGRPAIIYWQLQLQRVHYAYADSTQPTNWTDITLPEDVVVDSRMALLEVNGRPWLLYSRTKLDSVLDPALVIMRSNVGLPTSATDFSGYELYGAQCDADAVLLREVKGGLAALFSDEDRAEGKLVYAYSDKLEPEQADWQFASVGDPLQPVWDYGMADFDGRAGILLQSNKELYWRLAADAAPQDAGDWAGHQVLDLTGQIFGNAAGVDLHERNGQPAAAVAWGNLESPGAVIYILGNSEQLPAAEQDWTGGTVTLLNDQEPRNISMAYIDEIPFICWSDDNHPNAWLGSGVNPVPGYLNGLWEGTSLPGPAGADRARQTVSLIVTEDGLGAFWSTQNPAFEPDRLQTVYSWWKPKP
ncbi:MAG: hypothetical protein R3F46_05690 [bacterium]